MPRSVVRGNPIVDAEFIDLTNGLIVTVKSYLKSLKKNKRNLDGLTVMKVSEQLHRTNAILASCQAELEQLKRVRQEQKTSVFGGGRKKAVKLRG
jgi:hypothetical protein